MRQGLDLRGSDREVGVKQIRQSDAVGFGSEAEERTVGVEAIGTSRFNNLEGGLVATINEAFADFSVGSKH
jgi:hypothetical protein